MMTSPARQPCKARRLPKKKSSGAQTPAQAFAKLKKTITPQMIAKLKAMPYDAFLGTVFWKTVREYKLFKQKYTCALCPSKDRVQVHHRKYDHARGGEHLHLEDLIGLCRDCHAKFHDKLP